MLILNNSILFITLLRLIGLDLSNFRIPIVYVWQLREFLLDVVLECDNFSCITISSVLLRVFYEFRNFSRQVVSELNYYFVNLAMSYFKKLSGIITRIIQDKGQEAFEEKSRCIRTRIGQYFLPKYLGQNTSSCSEFDGIILSFSEQPFDDERSIIPLLLKFGLIIVLILIEWLVIRLLRKEWQIYNNCKDNNEVQRLISSHKTRPSSSLSPNMNSRVCLNRDTSSISKGDKSVPPVELKEYEIRFANDYYQNSEGSN
ncbi:unnamed protein product [Moneuplotes crassus]|uniref:Uncharacterized protein n=1 Tax=Euplotes crassus TaxID=5936 RepID=A0AAD2D0Q3_EUPCR|nr:unnamed protein product [Moneuplotes crassus]